MQNDVNVTEATCEERQRTEMALGRYRFVGEIGKVTIEMWIFADWGEWGYCSVVWSPQDKGARDTGDSLAVPLDHI